jgi:hypothetical protein
MYRSLRKWTERRGGAFGLLLVVVIIASLPGVLFWVAGMLCDAALAWIFDQRSLLLTPRGVSLLMMLTWGGSFAWMVWRYGVWREFLSPKSDAGRVD